MSTEDPLFILYTSGSTGKPKEVMHTGGYIVYASMTQQHGGRKEGDVYWYTRCGLGYGTQLHCLWPVSKWCRHCVEGVETIQVPQDFGKWLINIRLIFLYCANCNQSINAREDLLKNKPLYEITWHCW